MVKLKSIIYRKKITTILCNYHKNGRLFKSQSYLMKDS